jgi:hypothetical protein
MIFKDICLSDSTLLLVYTVPKYLPAPTILVIHVRVHVSCAFRRRLHMDFLFLLLFYRSVGKCMVHCLIFYLVERKHKALHHSLQM